MKRGKPLRADPEKVREWLNQPRSAALKRSSGLKRSGRRAKEPDSLEGRGTRERVCAREGCTKTLIVRASEALRGKRFCSRECWREHIRSEKHRREERARQQGRRNPKNAGKNNGRYKDGKRVGDNDRIRRRRWEEYPLGVCAGGCGRRAIHRHHVVYRQHVRGQGDEWDPRNALGLCDACHSRHHRQRTKLPLPALRPENVAFAFELLGPAAYDYLTRRYSGVDARIERALEELQ